MISAITIKIIIFFIGLLLGGLGWHFVIAWSLKQASTRHMSPRTQKHRKTPQSYNNIIFDSREDAEDVLDGLQQILDKYNNVSIGDFNDITGIIGSFTDHKYGWKDLSGASVTRSLDGYVLNLPRVILLDPKEGL